MPLEKHVDQLNENARGGYLQNLCEQFGLNDSNQSLLDVSNNLLFGDNDLLILVLAWNFQGVGGNVEEHLTYQIKRL